MSANLVGVLGFHGEWWVLAGSFTVLDTRGEALALGIKSTPIMSQTLKRLGSFWSWSAARMPQPELAHHILVMGVSCPVISFGCDGALLVTDHPFCLLGSLTIVEMNPAGAGDSFQRRQFVC